MAAVQTKELADTVNLIATGEYAPALTEGGDDSEWRKRTTAALRESPSLVLIDNQTRRLDSGALSAALERRVWQDSYLGLSKLVTVPIMCTWLCTDNNPSFSGEIARRSPRIRLDAEVEDPSVRQGFRHPDLRHWVRANRGTLLWAVLTMIRVWASRGMPAGTGVMGSYESYVSVIGGILDVGGIQGFRGNRRDVYNGLVPMAWQ